MRCPSEQHRRAELRTMTQPQARHSGIPPAIHEAVRETKLPDRALRGQMWLRRAARMNGAAKRQCDWHEAKGLPPTQRRYAADELANSDSVLCSFHSSLGMAQRPRCAAGAALWLREPTGACLLAVGTNALLGNDVERRKVKLEARAALSERTTTRR